MRNEYINILKDLSEEYEEFSYFQNRKELINSENFFIFLYVNKIKPDVIFESGYYEGRSSLIILETLKRFSIKCDYYIACIHKNPCVYFENSYDNFNLMIGKGEKIAKSVAQLHGGKRILSLVDSPKFKYYDKCERLYDVLFNNFDVQAIFQHDVHRGRDMANYKRYYNKKVVKDRYGFYKIGSVFLDECFDLLEEEKIEEQKLGVICNRDLFIENISI